MEKGQSPVVTVIRDAGQPGMFVRQMPRSSQPVPGPRFSGQSARISPHRRDYQGIVPSRQRGRVPTLGGRMVRAFDINAAGQVVGVAVTAAGAAHAFLYSDGAMKDLGTLGGSNSCAYGINNRGQVVGSSDTATGQCRAFLYTGGTMKDLDALDGSASVAYGVNDAGQVVGVTQDSRGVGHAFLYASGRMADIGSLGGSSSPPISTPRGKWRATRSSPAATRTLFFIAAVPGSPTSAPSAPATVLPIVSTTPGKWWAAPASRRRRPSHAFLYTAGSGMKDLGALGRLTSHAFGINAAGQVVGTVQTASAGFHAFLCTAPPER